MAIITVDTDDLVTLTQIAEIYGVSRSAVANWLQRHHRTFPAPVIATPAVRLWSKSAVARWAAGDAW